jgi:hypothetical protein
VARSIGEAAVEVTLLEVENTFLTVRNILGEEVVEVVGLEGEEDATTVRETGGKDQVQKEPAETATLARCSGRSRQGSLGFWGSTGLADDPKTWMSM